MTCQPVRVTRPRNSCEATILLEGPWCLVAAQGMEESTGCYSGECVLASECYGGDGGVSSGSGAGAAVMQLILWQAQQLTALQAVPT